MPNSITPVFKESLADNLAREIKKYILRQPFRPGDKLPSTSELARRFGVGLPTLREALKKLETTGAIDVRHGSGIYVGDHLNSIFLMNPIISSEGPSQKQFLDLIDVRIAIEPTTAALAAQNATAEQLNRMRSILKEAQENFDNHNLLHEKNMDFHRMIAEASGNAVFRQIMSVLTNQFQSEQRQLLDIFPSKEVDYQQHLEIFDVIRQRDHEVAGRLMTSHLQGVRSAILTWDGRMEETG